MTCKTSYEYAETSNIAPVKYDDSLGGYDQKLYIKGRMVSSIKASKQPTSIPNPLLSSRRKANALQETGKSKGFYTDVECQGKHVGIVKAHSA